MNGFFLSVLVLLGNFAGTLASDTAEKHDLPEHDESVKVHKATVLLPFAAKEQEVFYELQGNVPVIDGDIVLNLNPAPIEAPSFQSFDKNGKLLGPEDHDGDGLVSSEHEISAINGERYRWPRGVVPYAIHENVGQALRKNIDIAIAEMNATNIEFIPRTNERDYVEFVARTEKELGGAVGRSSVGRQQCGRQQIELLQTTDPPRNTKVAPKITVLHEMGHAIGLWHEHQRTDRDDHIVILWDNIDLDKKKFLFFTIKDPVKVNFGRKVGDSITSGPFDPDSFMGYESFSASKKDANGNPLPTILLKDGSLITRLGKLTALDVAGINELYPESSDGIDVGSVPSVFLDRNFGNPVELRSSARHLGDLDIYAASVARGFGVPRGFIERRVRGIRVPSGWRVRLYRKPDFGGETIEFTGPTEIPDLRKAPMKRDNGKGVFEGLAQVTWNEQAQSVEVDGPGAKVPPPSEAVVLYQHSHWRGRRLDTEDWQRNLRDKPHQFNDLASSLSVPAGRTVELYEAADYKGRMIRIVGPMDIENLHRAPDGRNWGELVSSVKIFGGPGEARERERVARARASHEAFLRHKENEWKRNRLEP